VNIKERRIGKYVVLTISDSDGYWERNVAGLDDTELRYDRNYRNSDGRFIRTRYNGNLLSTIYEKDSTGTVESKYIDGKLKKRVIRYN
jgi:hypothetical protein